MSWQPAILVGSWDCSHRKNELTAARRWLRCEVRKRCSNTAKSVAIAGAFRDGWDDVAVGTLHAGGDVRVGLGGQPQVVIGAGDGGVAHVGLQDRQQRGDVLAAGEP